MRLVKPRMAFIVDIRRGNLDLHLMYKALFELSADRAEFVSRLFSKALRSGLSEFVGFAKSSMRMRQSTPSDAVRRELRAIRCAISPRHTLFASDRRQCRDFERTHRAFYIYGPNIQYFIDPERRPPGRADVSRSDAGDRQGRTTA